MKRIACLLCLGLIASGCGMGPSGFPKELATVAEKMATMVEEQGVMDDFASNIAGTVNNPGMESYVGMELTAGVRIAGVDGSIDLTTSGTGTQLPAGVRKALIEQLDGPLSDDQRAAILAILGWNRTVSPHNPPPDPQ